MLTCLSWVELRQHPAHCPRLSCCCCSSSLAVPGQQAETEEHGQ